MELRVLHYFLAVAREQSISGAAEVVHVSQPALSTQLKALEDELGKQLLIRGGKGTRKVTLTEEGMILRQRAEEIFDLVSKAEQEVRASADVIAGDIRIGAGETDCMRYFARSFHALQQKNPGIHFHIASGNSTFVTEQLDKGLIDFGLLYGEIDGAKYEAVELPAKENFGVLMRKDSPLAKKKFVTPEDLWDKPLIVSHQDWRNGQPVLWKIRKDVSKLNIVATYTLLYNGSLLVDEGVGYAICFDKLLNTSGDSALCFRPLKPEITVSPFLVWKKYQLFSKAAAAFLKTVLEVFGLKRG